MSLKSIVGEKILNEVIKSVKVPGEWKALVLDPLSTRVVSSCCKMRDIVMEGITIVEDLTKGRQSLPLEAIYFVSPTDSSVQAIIDDFKDSNNPRYTGAHIFFTEVCPEILFEKFAKASCSFGRRVKTLKEINIAYMPVEMQVFSLDNKLALAHLYSPSQATMKEKRPICIDQIAEQLATLCASLGEYPSIRYRSASQLSLDIAQALLNRLNAYKADDPSMGEGQPKQQSQMIILDRGFDLVSPLLHELTYQAMAYDLLDIQNDVYKYEVQSGGEYIPKEALLDENDDLWVALRHKHIANVLKEINSMIKEFSELKRISGPGTKEATTIKDLSLLLKKMPQYQKELIKYSLHLNLAEECLHVYNKNQIEKLCAVEQDLATGVDKDGEKISKDHMRAIVPVLLDQSITENNKLRIILLYAIMKQGISEESMNKLMEHAKISHEGKKTIYNISNLDVPIVQDSGKKKPLPSRKERSEETYQLSRYVPYLKDIMEDVVESKLDSKLFPYLMTREGGALLPGVASTARSARMYGNWHKDKSQADTKSLPRLFVFIVGGASLSEVRVGYEVGQANKSWEILVGGTEILTPETFLERASTLV
ncbi:syntaxin-binding protein 1 [Hydra vulgaris]|uniref:Syntaxin-binding protein 1 n=1 Tax=Hydra vulgaris TaxID=6087 RepID=T2MED3_HYDVU|nr:syntaxin-binding protein 1 [Hydra vulgaris]